MGETSSDPPGLLDFDAFWAEQRKTTTPMRIMGEVVALPGPGTLSMNLQWRMQQVDHEDETQIQALLGEVFGDVELVERWQAQGMPHLQFVTLLVWVAANGSGKPITLEAAARRAGEVLAAQTLGEGPRPAARTTTTTSAKKATKTSSARTGR